MKEQTVYSYYEGESQNHMMIVVQVSNTHQAALMNSKSLESCTTVSSLTSVNIEHESNTPEADL